MIEKRKPRRQAGKSDTRQSKYSKINHEAELRAIRNYLANNTATARMAAEALNIQRPNFCRHKRSLEKAELLKELFISECKISGFKAAYLSCNPQLVKGA